MSRTLRAALVAAVVVGVTLAATGVFLGLPTGPSVWTGVIAGGLSGLLLLAAGRRAETFHPTDPGAHLADHRPTHPDTPGPSDEPPASDRPDDPSAGA